MASKNESALKLYPGKAVVVEVKNGPNDWDLWLAFRTIIDGVEFRLVKTILIPEIPDFAARDMGAAITGLTTSDHYNPCEIFVTGISRTIETSVQINFCGLYNVQTRKGLFTLNLFVR
ncbi:MAG: hypothetical protein Q7S36_02805 [Candidatus Liptonbacteria bacterium]|nr:hypothetical protein [Candidatus Liptonbacteria bacterium]